MPKQISPVVKLKGKIDQLSFFETQDGYMARKAATFNIDRFRTAETYDVPRRNASEFGIAGKAAKLFRAVWKPEIKKAADNRLTSRITRRMVKALQTDPTSEYGFRRVEKGNFTDLEGLDFNNGMPFSAVVSLVIPVTIARVTGDVTLDLPAYVPKDELAAPTGATHYNLFAAAAAIDFATGEWSVDRISTPDLLYDKTPTAANPLQLTLPANSTKPLFVVLGIQFMKKVNGVNYHLSENVSALKLMAISVPPPVGL
jgi:hypothetical protein